MTRELSTYSPEFQAFVRSICGYQECECFSALCGGVAQITRNESCQGDVKPADEREGSQSGRIRREKSNRLVTDRSHDAGVERAAAAESTEVTEFPQHLAEAAEREESRILEPRKDLAFSYKGHGIEGGAVTDSSQNFSSELFTALVSAGGVL